MEIPLARVVTGLEILAASNAMGGSNENKRGVAHGVSGFVRNNNVNIALLFPATS